VNVARWLAAICVVLLPRPAAAQPGATIQDLVEWSFGVGLNGPVTFSPSPGALTRPSGSTLNLFEVDARLGWAVPVSTRLAFRLNGSIQFEATGTVTPNTVTVGLADDAEAVTDLVLTEPARQLLVESGLVLHLKPRGKWARTVPFFTTGMGVFWDVHDEAAAQLGQQFFAGGGVKYSLRTRPRGRVKVLGLRSDLRVTLRSGGMALDDDLHVLPGFGASLFARF
jgi:hypothetical protein